MPVPTQGGDERQRALRTLDKFRGGAGTPSATVDANEGIGHTRDAPSALWRAASRDVDSASRQFITRAQGDGHVLSGQR